METKSVRLYGHVVRALEEHKREGETFADTVDRLLPEDLSTVEYPEEEARVVWVYEDKHKEIHDCAGQNANASDVIEHHLREEGLI